MERMPKGMLFHQKVEHDMATSALAKHLSTQPDSDAVKAVEEFLGIPEMRTLATSLRSQATVQAKNGLDGSALVARAEELEDACLVSYTRTNKYGDTGSIESKISALKAKEKYGPGLNLWEQWRLRKLQAKLNPLAAKLESEISALNGKLDKIERRLGVVENPQRNSIMHEVEELEKQLRFAENSPRSTHVWLVDLPEWFATMKVGNVLHLAVRDSRFAEIGSSASLRVYVSRVRRLLKPSMRGRTHIGPVPILGTFFAHALNTRNGGVLCLSSQGDLAKFARLSTPSV